MNHNFLIYYKNWMPYIFPIVCIYLVFFNYRFFGLVAIIYFFIREQENIGDYITKRFKNFYLFFPLFFYSIRFVFATSPYFDSQLRGVSQSNYFEKARFLDLQHLFLELFCNKKEINFSYKYFFDESWSNSCPYNNYWGPLSRVLTINIDNILLLTLLTSFVVLVLIYIIYFKSYKHINNNHDLLFLISLSPPLNFLIDRMNVDIIIYLVCFWIFKSENLIYLKLTILVFFSLYKIHPLFLLFGFLGYFLIKKDIKKTLFTFFCLLTSGIVIINYYLNNEFYTARPFQVKWSFGILSDAISLNKFFGLNLIVFYIGLILVILFFTFYLYLHNKNKILTDDISVFVISIWFLLTSLYANYDYRIPLLYFIFFKLYKFKNKLLNYSLFIFIFFSPPPAFSNNLRYSNIVENNIFYLDLSFYFLVSFLILILFESTKNVFLLNKTN